jgi:hypothetical protein
MTRGILRSGKHSKQFFYLSNFKNVHQVNQLGLSNIQIHENSIELKRVSTPRHKSNIFSISHKIKAFSFKISPKILLQSIIDGTEKANDSRSLPLPIPHTVLLRVL